MSHGTEAMEGAEFHRAETVVRSFTQRCSAAHAEKVPVAALGAAVPAQKAGNHRHAPLSALVSTARRPCTFVSPYLRGDVSVPSIFSVPALRLLRTCSAASTHEHYMPPGRYGCARLTSERPRVPAPAYRYLTYSNTIGSSEATTIPSATSEKFSLTTGTLPKA